MSLRINNKISRYIRRYGHMSRVAVLILLAMGALVFAKTYNDHANAAVDSKFIFDNPNAIIYNPTTSPTTTYYTGAVLSGGIETARTVMFAEDKVTQVGVSLPCSYAGNSSTMSCRVGNQDDYNRLMFREGVYYIKAEVTSTTGQYSEAWKRIVIDKSAPTISAKEPAIVTQPTSATVFASDIDYGVSGLGSMRMRVYDSVTNKEIRVGSMPCKWSTASCNISLGVELLKPAHNYYVTTVAVDGAGNSDEVRTHEIKMQPSAPTIVSAMSNGKDVANGYTNDQNVTLNWNAVPEAISYEYSYWNEIPTSSYHINNKYTPPAQTGLSSSGVFNQGEGKHYLAVRSVAANGTKSEWSVVSVIYDKTDPQVTIVLPEDKAVLEGSVDVVGEITDANIANSKFTITNSEGEVILSGTSTGEPQQTLAWDTLKVSAGKYTIQFEATDSAGNTASTVTNVTVVNTQNDVVGGLIEKPTTTSTPNASNTDVQRATPTRSTPLYVAYDNDSNTTPAEEAITTQPSNEPNVLGQSTANSGVVSSLNSEDIMGTKSCSTILGLCWYWWIPITIATVAAIWFLTYLSQRREEESFGSF